MKIVLCNEVQSDLLYLKASIMQHLDSIDAAIQRQFYIYSDLKTLRFDLEDIGDFAVFFLDIDLPSGNGIDMVREILSQYPHSLCFFYTSQAEYAIEGYRSGARRYILKTDSEGIAEAMDFAIWQMEEDRNKYFQLKLKDEYIFIDKEKILYVSGDGHYLEIHMSTEEIYRKKMGIREFYELLEYRRLWFIDRSVFINIDYVTQICKDEVILIKDIRLPISRRRSKEVIEHILKERFG